MTTTENTTTTRPEPTRPAPDPDCSLCPRLCAFRQGNRQAEPDWSNAPVPSFGPRSRLSPWWAWRLACAVRTGPAGPFTGDFAGAVLYPALWRHGFARGSYGADPRDGFELVDCRISNAVRCVPPRTDRHRPKRQPAGSSWCPS